MSTHSFYGGSIQLEFNEGEHVYYRETDGVLLPQDGVTTVCHIIDHSVYLMPWAVKMMYNKLLADMRRFDTDGAVSISWNEFEKLTLDAKLAHRKHFLDAADVGTLAHEWLQNTIQDAIDSNSGVVLCTEPEGIADAQAASCASAALDWMHKHNVRFLHTERKIYSREHGFAGTMDGLAYVDACDDSSCCPTWFIDELSLIDWKSSNNLSVEYLYQTAAYQAAYQEEFGTPIDSRWILRLGKEDGKFEAWYEKDFEDDFIAFLACLSLYRQHRSVEARMKASKKLKVLNKREARKKVKNG